MNIEAGKEIWPSENNSRASFGWVCNDKMSWDLVKSDYTRNIPMELEKMILRHRVVILKLTASVCNEALQSTSWYQTHASQGFHRDRTRDCRGKQYSEDGADYGALLWPHMRKRPVHTAFCPHSEYTRLRINGTHFEAVISSLKEAKVLFEVFASEPQITFYDNNFMVHSSVVDQQDEESVANHYYRRLYKKQDNPDQKAQF